LRKTASSVLAYGRVVRPIRRAAVGRPAGPRPGRLADRAGHVCVGPACAGAAGGLPGLPGYVPVDGVLVRGPDGRAGQPVDGLRYRVLVRRSPGRRRTSLTGPLVAYLGPGLRTGVAGQGSRGPGAGGRARRRLLPAYRGDCPAALARRGQLPG